MLKENRHRSKIQQEAQLSCAFNDLFPFIIGQSHDSFTLPGVKNVMSYHLCFTLLSVKDVMLFQHCLQNGLQTMLTGSSPEANLGVK
jgi:hypothetical protein